MQLQVEVTQRMYFPPPGFSLRSENSLNHRVSHCFYIKRCCFDSRWPRCRHTPLMSFLTLLFLFVCLCPRSTSSHSQPFTVSLNCKKEKKMLSHQGSPLNVTWHVNNSKLVFSNPNLPSASTSQAHRFYRFHFAFTSSSVNLGFQFSVFLLSKQWKFMVVKSWFSLHHQGALSSLPVAFSQRASGPRSWFLHRLPRPPPTEPPHPS